MQCVHYKFSHRGEPLEGFGSSVHPAGAAEEAPILAARSIRGPYLHAQQVALSEDDRP